LSAFSSGTRKITGLDRVFGAFDLVADGIQLLAQQLAHGFVVDDQDLLSPAWGHANLL
jgi:hypothetical protein